MSVWGWLSHGVRAHRAAVIVFSVSLAACLAVGSSVMSEPSRAVGDDSIEYLALAREFPESYVDFDSDLAETALLRTPGYPAFVSATSNPFGHSLVPLVVVQCVLGAATSLLTYRLGRVLLDRSVGLVAGLFVALDPISVVSTAYVLTETLFTFLLTAGVVLLCSTLVERGSRPRTWLAGALVGMAALVRPIGVYLPLVLIPIVMVIVGGEWRRRASLALLFALGFLVPVGALVLRNHAATGVPVVSTIEGLNVLEYRAAPVLARAENLSLEEARSRLRARVEASDEDLTPVERAGRERSIGMEVLRTHPRELIAVTLEAAFEMLTGLERGGIGDLLGLRIREASS